ncbi:Methyltransferase-like protein 7A [Zancudomyces culisetae]|uniref:Methyltransferase-like protein 7A n=1 Tax=Zancudomyces culisetae TaxID=1213189 RepID=A0A1R1PX39_ZANCU|nr:Methyltransferase-like protein 7A [Zancudomyces culisetae]|eukprot:OMH85511.1 Methyltransferase-like protein 7A [Zancudomyces culisetae]
MILLLVCIFLLVVLLARANREGTLIRKASDTIFGFGWSFLSENVDKEISGVKKELYSEVSGNVLEIGAGLGTSLKYLNMKKIKRFLAVEPNKAFHEGIEREALKTGFVVDYITTADIKQGKLVEKLKTSGNKPCLYIYGEFLAKNPETQELVASFGFFDSVIISYVLCSVGDVEQMLGLMGSVLSKSGKLYFNEHVSANENGSASEVIFHYFQELVTPIWGVFLGNCHLNRRTGEMIENSAYFKNVKIKRTTLAKSGFSRLLPVVYGSAEKA